MREDPARKPRPNEPMRRVAPELQADTLVDRQREFARNRLAAWKLTGNLSGHAFWWRPKRRRWSVAECLEHLVLAQEAYFPVIDASIGEARRREMTSDRPPRLGPLGRLLVRGVEPPARLRIPAPRSIRPERPSGDAPRPAAGAPGSPLDRFVGLLGRIDRRLAAADGLDLERARVRSPFVPLVTVTLDAVFRVMSGHERRHLAQARRVTGHEDFPHPRRA